MAKRSERPASKRSASTPTSPASGTVVATIRGAGLRCTPARVAVLEHLVGARGPRTHAEVADALVDRGFDRATIYRNLTELTAARMVVRVDLGDHVWRVEVARPASPGSKGEDHPHFVCTSCGDVSCLDDVKVTFAQRTKAARASKQPRGGGAAGGIRAVKEVLLKGTCADCG
ncbi:MAG: Fur family transcriptional regulator [Planctomycetia bacterium]